MILEDSKIEALPDRKLRLLIDVDSVIARSSGCFRVRLAATGAQ
jgi:hypothetical protein